MEQFCQLVGGRDDVWYVTNMEIVDYIKAYDKLKFSADLSFVYNPTAHNVWLSVNDFAVDQLKPVLLLS